jgi:hypothetical protein
MITSLLAQLVYQHWSVPERLYSRYDAWQTAGRKDRPSASDFTKLLTHCVSEFPKVFIVLDAFDETPKDVRKNLIEHLQLLRKSEINLFITTRSTLASTLKQSFLNSVELKITAQDDDVYKYLMIRLEAEDRVSAGLKKHIATVLKIGAGGKYILVFYLADGS